VGVDNAWEQDKLKARKMVSSQYFGVTIFKPRQIRAEMPFFRLSWHIWQTRFVATPFF
jgi:hypothetical protein